MLANILKAAVSSVPPGQQAFTTAGTFSFVVPNGVTSICAVCIGSGQSGRITTGPSDDGFPTYHWGGDGGDLSWSNDISVTPGETLTINVPSRAANQYTSPAGPANILRGSTVLVQAKSGGASTSNVRQGGGNGGLGDDSDIWGRLAGGAGGYSGNGGGRSGSGVSTPTGGAAGAGTHVGGGVGLQGIGATGANGGQWGGGGSGGSSGDAGGLFGGGGSSNNLAPGRGAVRIIWGAGRSFPSNAADV